MKKYLTFILLAVSVSAFGQLKLKDIPYDLNTINKRDTKGMQGVWFFYDKKDSVILYMQNFKNDTLNGYYERYYPNGMISEKGYYKDGKDDGTAIGYWENGQKRIECYFVNGLLNGIATSFNEEGKITTRVKYLRGEIDSAYAESFIDSTLIWDSPVK